jgi:MYXO-CTERM domain-containing protein
VKRPLAAFTLSLLLGGSSALGASLPNVDAYGAAPALGAAPPRVPGASPPAFVASTDDRRGVPTFLWAARSTSPDPALHGLSSEAAARLHLARHAARYGLGPAALAAAKVVQVLDTGRGGIVVVLRQEVQGTELFHQDIKLLMDRSLALVAIGGNLHPAAGSVVKGASFKLGEQAALAAAFKDLYGLSLTPADFPDRKESKGAFRYYDLAQSPAVAAQKLHLVEPARVKKVFFPLPDRLVPAYFLELVAGSSADTDADVYAYVIAADDGRLLHRENLTHHDAFQYRAFAEAGGDKRPFDGPLADFTPHPTGVPDGSYPGFTAPNLISIDGFNKPGDPWLPAGAAASTGNNVDAYTDNDAPDGFSQGDLRATPTSPGVFDRVFDPSAAPQSSNTQKMAAITDLFYVTNWMHDWWYDSGFDEAGGNAQQDNLGRGGIGGDRLHAEAQDGAPQKRNNSDMSVPSDGMSPRMQMYVWDGISNASVGVQPLGQSFSPGVADFGPQSFNQMGPIVLVNDGNGTTTDACQAIVNNVAGSIALLDRGNCTFKQKAINVQAAGAIGFILADNQPAGAPPPMANGNPNGAVNIPGLSVTQAQGNAIKAALMNGAQTATLTRTSAVDRDGTIDNTVIAHEWGHYLHLRNVLGCDSTACGAESEGWADFNAAMMTLRPGDNLDATYAMAQYATAAFPEAGYFGIRRYPYSTDMSKSPLTFKHISDGVALPAGPPVADNGGNNAEVHNAGEVWAVMLFEAYVALLKKATGPNPPYTFDEARRRMGDYVVAGMKVAPANPTYTEQRDGVLAAAAASDLGDLVTLAQAFAKRGAGSCAVSPPRTSQDLTGVVESFELKASLSILGATLDDSIVSCDNDGVLDAGETGKVMVEVMNIGTAALAGASITVSTSTPGVVFPNGPTIAIDPLSPYTKGTASIAVALDNTITKKTKLALHVTADVPSGCAGTAALDTSPFVHYDLAPASSKLDDMEASSSLWTPAGPNAESIWSRSEVSAGNHAWRGVDFDSPSDTALVSPPLKLDPNQSFTISFKHRYQFENSMGVNWDGGVIELSEDGGANWKDVSQYSNPGYTGKIGDPMNQAMNVLKDRQGFVDHNPSYPAMDAASIDLGVSLAGATVQVRFRIGTDDAAGEFGWELDDIGFGGIINTPFTALVDNVTLCAMGTGGSSTTGTGGNGGGGVTTTTGAGGNGGGGVTTTGTGGGSTSTATGSTTGSSGTGGAGGTQGSGGGGPVEFGGCGCVTAGDESEAPFTLPLLGLTLLAARRRRRR